jgi:uncharacterized membrane protein YbhN (UPF0104 family)
LGDTAQQDQEAGWKRWLRAAPAVLGVLLLIGAVYVVQREFRTLKITDIHRAMSQIPPLALAKSFGFAVAAYAILTLYDKLGTIFAGHRVSYARVSFASFCAYALSHNIGFATISGAAVRYRLYAHWGLTPTQIAKVIAFCALTFGLGAMMLAGGIGLFRPDAVPFFGERLPQWAVMTFGATMWAIDLAYIVVSRFVPRIRALGFTIELPGVRLAIAQVALATVDVSVTAAIFYALLPPTPGLDYVEVLAVYLASYSAGLVANLPGGIGVFDGAVLIGLSPYLDGPHIVSGILIFRLYYYVIPLFLAGSLFAGNEILLRGRAVLRAGGLAPIGRISEPDFAVAAASASVALCGFVLLSLGVLESRPDFAWIDPDIAAVLDQAGEFIPSLIGAALLVLAAALSQRVNLAWSTTIVLLLLAAAFMVAQHEPIWLPCLLVLTAILLAPYRTAFYRHARLLASPLQPATALPLVVLAVCVVALAAFERHLRWLADDSWWKVVLSPHESNSMRASVGLTVGLAVISMWRLLHPRRVTWAPWQAEQRKRYAALGANPPEVADGVVWGEAERAAIPFRRLGRSMVALGDPAGADPDRVSAIWRLRDLAGQEGRSPAVWQAGRSLLPVYTDLGLAALPLDGDGLPIAETFSATAPQERADSFLVAQPGRDLQALLDALPRLRARAPEHAPEHAAE